MTIAIILSLAFNKLMGKKQEPEKPDLREVFKEKRPVAHCQLEEYKLYLQYHKNRKKIKFN